MFIIKYIEKIIKEIRWIKHGRFENFWNYKHGFYTSTVSVCGINKDNYKDFLNDKDYLTGHPWNGAFTGIIDNKLYLPFLFKDYPQYIPQHFFYKDKSGFLKLTGKNRNKRYTIEDFFELLHKEGKLCLKHTHSSVGKGFMLVQYCTTAQTCKYSINNEEYSKKEIREIIDNLNEYIITEYVNQHEYARNICETSVNSIRMLCAWDYDKKTFFLARCFHRFGCNGNVVDNVGSGNGLLCFVDPETGVLLSYGAINANKQGDKTVENIIHPDKNIPLTGMQIPKFAEVKNKVIEIANTMSYLRWVGFDVVITDDGFKILETNSLSSLVDQGKKGYIKDPRLRKLFKK